jgi:hypothetical protein
MEYIKRYPNEWEIVQKCMGIGRGKSRHACAFLIANEPVHNFIPLTSVGGVKVTQPTAAQVESSGGLKMDFLIVNSLKDIGNAIKLIQERSGDTSLDELERYQLGRWARSLAMFELLPSTAPMMIDGAADPRRTPQGPVRGHLGPARASAGVPGHLRGQHGLSLPVRYARRHQVAASLQPRPRTTDGEETRPSIASRLWPPSRPSIARVPSMPS